MEIDLPPATNETKMQTSAAPAKTGTRAHHTRDKRWPATASGQGAIVQSPNRQRDTSIRR